MNGHPDWLAVGSEVLSQRWFSRRVDHEMVGWVVRQTPTTVLVRFTTHPGEKPSRFKLKDGRYVEVPGYLKYTTALAPARGVQGSTDVDKDNQQ